jgi:outer membrane receptor for ferrienterochelin and colicins
MVLLLGSMPGFAQSEKALWELDLDDLMKIKVESVFGASKFLQKVTDAPSAVSVVTAREIRIYGYRTLADVISSVPGFNITNDRNYSYVGVRGFQRPGDYNSRVLVLVDGHRMNEPNYDMAYLGTEFPVDLELIERVELIRGPSSSIYGTNAFFAVINVVTRKGRDFKGVQVLGEGGSLGTSRGHAAFGTTFGNGVDLLLSSSGYRSKGNSKLYFPEYDDPATNNGIAENADGDANRRLFGSLTYKGLTFQGVYSTRTKHVPTAAFDSSFNDPRFKTIDAHGWADLQYSRELPHGWQITGRVYYDNDNYDGYWPVNVSATDEPSVKLFADYGYAKWWGSGIDVEKTLASRHKLTAGAEYRDNFSLDQGAYEVDSGEVLFKKKQSSSVAAAFVEDQFTITNKLLLNAGIRMDSYGVFGSTTNPRLGLIFKPAEKTAIKLLWGTAFRAPNAYELYYENNVRSTNSALKPETIRTGEVVVEKYFSEHYRLITSVYSSTIQGLINPATLPDGTFQFMNLDSATRTRGFEAEFEAKWRSGIASRASYSNQHAVDQATGTGLVNSASQLATLNVMAPFLHRAIMAGVDLHFVGPVQTVKGGSTKPFVVPNLTFSTRDLRNGLSLSASVYNVFGKAYGYPGSDEHRQNIIYQDGRTLRVGLKYTWHTTDN